MNKKNIKYYTDVISDENNLKKNIFSQIKNRNLFFYSNHQAGLSIESTSKTDKFIINKFTDIWKKIKKLNFIAEICQNHQGKFFNIEKMIYDCADAGASIVKAQYIFSNNLTYRPIFENGYKKNNTIESIKRPYLEEKRRLRKLDLKKKDYEKFVRVCEKASVKPMITCFAREHINDLKNIGFKYIKVASYECASFQMLKELSKKFDKMVISTGATYDNEIEFTSNLLKNKFLFYFHCVSIYPTPLNFLNLSRINFLKKFSKNVGYSDHSLSIDKKTEILLAVAIVFGASYLETHYNT